MLKISKKIFIDAGHNYSGWNTGVEGNGLREQDVTFEVAKILSDILQLFGLTTKLSRPTKETNLGTTNSSSIKERYTMSNSWGADYFISIHCNSGKGTGAETLYAKINAKKYATTIQNVYVDEMKLKNRGIKYRFNLGVLNNSKAPAIIVELAFIDTKEDAEILANKKYEMAVSIAKGFCKFLDIQWDDSKLLKNEEEEEEEVRYNVIDEIPEWGKETIKKLIENEFIVGDGASLNLSEDMIRIFVAHDRAGMYDSSSNNNNDEEK